MQINLIHTDNSLLSDLMGSRFNSRNVSDIIFEGYRKNCNSRSIGQTQDCMWALPYRWKTNSYSQGTIFYQGGTLLLSDDVISKIDKWLIICDGEVVTFQDDGLFAVLVDEGVADVITLNITPELKAGSEKICITSKGFLAGIRRYYHDSVQFAEMPSDWPHYTFIRKSAIERALSNNCLAISFFEFRDVCLNNSLIFKNFRMGGDYLDLKIESSVLRFLRKTIDDLPMSAVGELAATSKVRLFGKVALGGNVSIGENSVIVGPTIIADNVKIDTDTVIRQSVICTDKTISRGSILQSRVVTNSNCGQDAPKQLDYTGLNTYETSTDSSEHFCKWSMFSYPRLVKRMFDIVAAIVVLTLFLPIYPFIYIAIKLNMPGPIFFKHERQGLHGKVFNCLKFRTMIVNADKIQSSLRIRNQVDGPQFKIEDDPRVTAVGSFLRDTFIDEIPQFINVLLGQMSLVGPRPSPEEENSLCPVWCDARLSVKPGITGLWQISRTRQQGQDFQEWIYYDMKYVRGVSFILDLRICVLTIKKLLLSFVEQF